eukprot:scaffold20035_cov83-Skeletonema_dohrnii-CCMP3373.AAC.2
MYPRHIQYDGGLTCGTVHYATDPVPEPFPPGTRVTIEKDGVPVKGTVQNVPMVTSPLVSSSTDDSDD